MQLFTCNVANVIHNFLKLIRDILQYLIAGCIYYAQEITQNMTESSESKLCRLCGCDNIDNKNIFDESEELLYKLRTTFCFVVSRVSCKMSFIIDLWIRGGHCFVLS